jgi:hypothetical protein
VLEAQATVTETRNRLRRPNDLIAKKLASPEELDVASAAFARAEAALAVARAQVEGVVTYETLLSEDNSAPFLRPGMTGTAEILVEPLHDLVLVPNGALRFAPPTISGTPGRAGGLVGMLLHRPPQEGQGQSVTGHEVLNLGCCQDTIRKLQQLFGAGVLDLTPNGIGNLTELAFHLPQQHRPRFCTALFSSLAPSLGPSLHTPLSLPLLGPFFDALCEHRIDLIKIV